MKSKYCVLAAVLALMVAGQPVYCQQSIIPPAEDVYVITFGGGEGCNPFLKYNISTVPASMTIDSVFLMPCVWQIIGNWDGDANFWNVNSQTWTEADSARLIWNLPTSNQISQGSGFCTAMGVNRSVDLSSIFLVDYNASNTYCSIKIKDPDDGTFQPMPGSYPVNSNDTLALGDRAYGRYVYFYPSEYANAPPWLVVYYHDPGAANETGARVLTEPAMVTFPNPFSSELVISYNPGANCSNAVCRIFDVSGYCIKSMTIAFSSAMHPAQIIWNGTDNKGKKLPSGVYYIRIDGENKIFNEQAILIR